MSQNQIQGITKDGEDKPVLVSPNGEIIVSPSNGIGRVMVETVYKVKTAFTDASIGDSVRKGDLLDISGDTPVVVAVTWLNISSGLELESAPSLANLEAVSQGGGLTLAQLISAGLSTANNQIAQIGYLADLADVNDRFGNFKLSKTEDLGAGIKYILKNDGVRWLLIKKSYSDTSTSTSYASAINNESIAIDQAWTNRSTLNYGSIGEV